MAIDDLGPFFDADGEDITESVLAEANSGNNVSGLRKKFEEGIADTKAEKEARALAEARAVAAEKQLVLRDSGLDMTNPMAAFFAENYNGDLTVDAVKAAAAKIGLIAQSQDPAIAAEVAALTRIGQAANTSSSGAGQVLSPEEELEAFQGTPEQFDAFYESKHGAADRNRSGAVWDKPQNVPVTTPTGR
jgi:hypothetical protein